MPAYQASRRSTTAAIWASGVLAPAVTRRVIERFAASPSSPGPAIATPRAAADGAAEAAATAELALLTERERDVLRLLADARSNAEIATELYIGEATVKTHLHRVFAKTGAARQADLVRLVAGFTSPLAR